MNKQYEIAEILRPGRESLSTLLSLWDEMGIEPSQREKRLQRVQETVSNLLHDLLAEERETKRAIVEQIEHLRRRIEDLSRELGVTCVRPQEEGLSMVKLEKELHTCLSGLKERKHQRLAHVEALRRRDAACCARLGEDPLRLDVPEGALPSSSQVTALENRVQELTQDMDHRLHEVRRLRDALQDCLHDLDLASPEDYSKWPLTAEPDVAERFPLSLPALVELESVLKKHQHRRETAAERYRELMARIDLLWKRLGSSPEDRKSLLDSLPNSQPASLRLLEAEVLRLEVLKQQNVAHFIEECKHELKEMRERCYIGVEESEEWDAAAAEEDAADLLLERYEKEIGRLRAYYEEHEATFAKIANWNSAFEKLRITELRMKDPSVLSNRGGVLLKYEKTKRAALKALKGLEVGLSDTDGVSVEGLPVFAYVERRRQAYEEEKENEKRQRQEKANSILKNESRFGCKPILTPTRKRTIAATNTPTSGLTFVGAHEQSKLRKIANNACQQFRLKRVSLAKRRQSKCGSGVPKGARLRLDRAGPAVTLVHSPAPFRPPVVAPARESADTTYTQFAQSINARSSLRQDSGLSSYRSGPTPRPE